MNTVSLTDTDNPFSLQWECGEWSGTITFPSSPRYPVELEWDAPEPPDEWEGIEEAVERAASLHLGARES